MNIRVFLIACVFLFGLTVNSFSQTPNVSADAEKLFDLAAARHKKELIELLSGQRGVPVPAMKDASLKSVSEILGMKDYGVRKIYSENTSLLLYSHEAENLHVWLVDEHGLQAYNKQTISEKQLAEAISALRASLRVNFLQQSRAPHQRGAELASAEVESKTPFDISLKNITNILLPPPVAAKLKKTKHLIIVPVLGIGTVPYAMLKPFGENSYLIDEMSVTIAPSLFDIGHSIYIGGASDLESWKEMKVHSPLVVGDPFLPKDSKWIVPPLPGAEAEARAVAKMIKTEPLIGKEATKANILSRIKNSDMLYIASHGIADSDNPLTGGFLMLSADNFEDGWWTAKEIQSSRSLRNIKLVVLSACQTGLGKVHNAGIIGLARAFQIAGARLVVMSLWNVDDIATNELMQAFIKYAGTTDNASETLRQAILDVKQRRPNPVQWASFTVFGTPR